MYPHWMLLFLTYILGIRMRMMRTMISVIIINIVVVHNLWSSSCCATTTPSIPWQFYIICSPGNYNLGLMHI